MIHLKSFFEIIKFHSKNSLPQTKATFRALTDAIIPKGALECDIEEYLIWALDHYLAILILIKNVEIHLANATAEMLNIASKELITSRGNLKPINSAVVGEQGLFAALEPGDRFRAIHLLEQLKVDLSSLPVPFLNNAGFVLAITRVLALLTTSGYYSEWSGYGSTRLEPPEKRILEHFPTGWEEVGYPGSSLGSHAFRGYIFNTFSE